MNQNTHYHLEILREFIEWHLNPQIIDTSENPSGLEEVLSFVQSELIRIKRKISENVNKQTDNKIIYQFIQKHQLGLIEILDTLMVTIETTTTCLKINKLHGSKDLLGVQKAVYLIIEDMLSYIGYRYYRYCNPNIGVSEKFKYLFFRKLENDINEIEEFGLKINKDLLEIALAPVKTLLINKKIKLSYGNVLFFKEVIRVLKDVSNIKNGDEYENELIRSLIFVNFNSVSLVQYCVKKMKLSLERRAQTVDKIELLALCLKRINQSPVRSGLSLLKNDSSIKNLLAHWVLEEICYWEKKLQLQVPLHKDPDYLVNTNIKIATSLPVPQLACFVRLLVETGTFTNTRKEDILEFFPEHYKSKKCETIEYGSFRSKFYSISEPTKEHIRDLIINMLNELRKL